MEEKDEPEQKTELKWVMVYQILHRLLQLIGYEGRVPLDSPGSDASDECDRYFSLDEIVMKEVLLGRDPQVIRHLLQHSAAEPDTPHIAYEELFSSLMGNIKAFYLDDSEKTCLEKNFFVFHSFAKGVLDLLQENAEIDPISVENELKLLDAAYFLTYNGLL